MTAEENAELDKHLKPLYAAWQSKHLGAIVAKIKQAHGVTLRQIEGACGVTSTYLSHVLKGRKEASATLRNLLEVYAAVPEEFRMRVTGKMVSAGHANELNTNSVPLFGGTIALYFKPIAYKNVSQLRDRFSNADAANEEFAA